MMETELICPCHFGLEAVLKREITDLGYEVSATEDGKVTFRGDSAAVARSNIFLRTAERVLLKAGAFRAVTFDELFEKTKALPWEDLLPRDAKVWVTKANSVKSALFSPTDIQSVMKKAIVERMKSACHLESLPETGAAYPLRVSILKDVVTVGIDTSGESLHKRGYRTDTVKAPISETLAAALLLLTPWKAGRSLADPFAGSGTFPIEAALIATRTAPGLNRSFLAENWGNLVPKQAWYRAAEEAMDLQDLSAPMELYGADIDPQAIRSAKENADRAGVLERIRFEVRDVKDFYVPGSFGFVVTNPPYGERLSEKKALPELYAVLGDRFEALDRWSMYLITSFEEAERYIGRKADRNRKIYNGMLKTYFYSFLGPKPPKDKE